MSCTFGYACLDCGKAVWARNHCDKELVEFFEIEKEFNTLLDKYYSLKGSLDLDFSALVRYWEDGFEAVTRFLKDHRGHKLCVEGEYRQERDRIYLKAADAPQV